VRVFAHDQGPTTFSITLRRVPEVIVEILEHSLRGRAPLIANVHRAAVEPYSPPGFTVQPGKFPYPKPGSPLLARATIVGEFRHPQHLWWVYSWGPDGKDDGGIVAYDPTNGTISRGDVGQFIGWE